jgi:APA family basic amino acid/polyamine antiporter
VKLASKRRRAIHVISVVTVPSHLPLDAPLGEQEEAAQSKIEQAKLIGGLRVSGHVHRARPNQAGHSIAEEARELKASALVMGLRYRSGVPLYGKALQTVLAERPCRVIVVGEPERARSAAGITTPVAGAPA